MTSAHLSVSAVLQVSEVIIVSLRPHTLVSLVLQSTPSSKHLNFLLALGDITTWSSEWEGLSRGRNDPRKEAGVSFQHSNGWSTWKKRIQPCSSSQAAGRCCFWTASITQAAGGSSEGTVKKMSSATQKQASARRNTHCLTATRNQDKNSSVQAGLVFTRIYYLGQRLVLANQDLLPVLVCPRFQPH